jgi:hypothetical protein
VPYGKVPGLAPNLPRKVEMPSKHPEVPGFKTIKVRYGPYKVPNMGVTTRTLTGPEEGMLWNYPDSGIQKPCSECMIVGIKPDYEDLTGSSVNIDAGHWMHHVSPCHIASQSRWLIEAPRSSYFLLMDEVTQLVPGNQIRFRIGW